MGRWTMVHAAFLHRRVPGNSDARWGHPFESYSVLKASINVMSRPDPVAPLVTTIP